jgi:hypothetical protein
LGCVQRPNQFEPFINDSMARIVLLWYIMLATLTLHPLLSSLTAASPPLLRSISCPCWRSHCAAQSPPTTPPPPPPCHPSPLRLRAAGPLSPRPPPSPVSSLPHPTPPWKLAPLLWCPGPSIAKVTAGGHQIRTHMTTHPPPPSPYCRTRRPRHWSYSIGGAKIHHSFLRFPRLEPPQWPPSPSPTPLAPKTTRSLHRRWCASEPGFFGLRWGRGRASNKTAPTMGQPDLRWLSLSISLSVCVHRCCPYMSLSLTPLFISFCSSSSDRQILIYVGPRHSLASEVQHTT